jgi:Leucine rich repeat
LALLLTVKIFDLFATADAKTVRCEKLTSYDWSGPVWTVKTCWMPTTTIDDPNTTILTNDSSMLGLRTIRNQKAEFLLVQVSESYPNLESYRVAHCAVSEVSKDNFAGLNKLKYLSLSHNEIERIDRNTFEDLISLEKLYLSKIKKVHFEFSILSFSNISDGNKINFLNGEVFRNLKNLRQVWLDDNDCISVNFECFEEIAILQQTVNEKCRFQETKPCARADNNQLQVLEASLVKSNALVVRLETESNSKDVKITTLNDQITTLRTEIEKLKFSNESCIAKPAEKLEIV